MQITLSKQQTEVSIEVEKQLKPLTEDLEERKDSYQKPCLLLVLSDLGNDKESNYTKCLQSVIYNNEKTKQKAETA